MCRLICSCSVRISKPTTWPSPLVGCDKPANMRMAVVFPAPLAPKNPKISPRRTLKLMPSTAWKPPKLFTKFFTSITACVPTPSCPVSPKGCDFLMGAGLKTARNCVKISSGVPMPFTSPCDKNATRSQHLTSSK